MIRIALLAFLLAGCAPTLPAMSQDLPESPLAPCPGTPNCERVSRAFGVPPSELREAAIEALRALGPSELDEEGLHAVYRVFVFKDDVHVAVGEYETGSILHIRSASRVGHSDLGVNGRRVARYFRELEKALG